MRKKKPEEHVNHERWLISYADFITLLFAFFVVMFAVSQVDSNKMGRFVESVNVAFEYKGAFPATSGNPLDGGGSGGNGPTSGKPTLMPSKIRLLPGLVPDQKMAAMKKAVEDMLKKSKLADKVKMRFDQRGITVSLMEAGFFDAGSAVVKQDALQTIIDIGSALRDSESEIIVEGHTDNAPIATAQFPSNWELSTARATAIIEVLEHLVNYDPSLMSASGYGEHRPMGDNATPEGRAMNRRVDIVIMTAAASAQRDGKSGDDKDYPDPTAPGKWGAPASPGVDGEAKPPSTLR